MPFYNYKCAVCGSERDAFHGVDERHNEKCCCKPMKIQISLGAKPVVYEGFDEMTGLYFTGAKQKLKAMREKGLVEY